MFYSNRSNKDVESVIQFLSLVLILTNKGLPTFNIKPGCLSGGSALAPVCPHFAAEVASQPVDSAANVSQFLL